MDPQEALDKRLADVLGEGIPRRAVTGGYFVGLVRAALARLAGVYFRILGTIFFLAEAAEAVVLGTAEEDDESALPPGVTEE